MNKPLRRLLFALLLIAATGAQAQRTGLPLPQQATTTPNAGSVSLAQQSRNNQGPVYIENKGQWDRRVRFLLRSGGLDSWITDHGVVYDLYQLSPASSSEKKQSRQISRRGQV